MSDETASGGVHPQPTLFDDRPDWQRTDKGQRFCLFHEANPWVADTLRQIARETLAATGGQRLGLKMIWEVLRWQALTRDDLIRLGGAPVLNNDHTAYYARLLMMEDEFADLFELRALRAA